MSNIIDIRIIVLQGIINIPCKKPNNEPHSRIGIVPTLTIKIYAQRTLPVGTKYTAIPIITETTPDSPIVMPEGFEKLVIDQTREMARDETTNTTAYAK